MKLPWISVLLLLFAPFVSCDTKGDFEGDFKKYFIKYYGEDGDQEAVDFVVNTDGTILLLGNSDAPEVGFQKIILTKVDQDGNILWQTKFGSGSDSRHGPNVVINENAQDIEPTPDGNFLILSNMSRGKDQSTNDELYDFKVIKINGNGVKLDSMEFGNYPDPNDLNNADGLWTTQFIRSITPLSSGGFIVTGNSTNEAIADEEDFLVTPPPDQEDVFTIRINDDKSIKWTTLETVATIGTYGEHYGSGIKVFEKSPNEFFLFQYSDKYRSDGSDNTYESNFNTFKITDNGVTTADYYSGTDARNEILAFVCQVPDQLGGGYYELGTSSPVASTSNAGQLYFCKRNTSLVKVDEGNINIPGDFIATCVAPSIKSEGFLILANEVTLTGKVIRLSKVALNNQPTWSVSFGSVNKDGNSGARVAELPDGKILVFGTIELETQKKMALIKLNSKGELLN